MSNETETLTHYRVWLRSAPGHYAQYDGKVDVYAEDREQAIERAMKRLCATSFPDRNAAMWSVDRVEELA